MSRIRGKNTSPELIVRRLLRRMMVYSDGPRLLRRLRLSGINVPRLLVASHIKPWHEFPEERLNPRNGLCLSALHDAAFDNGLITLDRDFRVVLSKRLRSYLPQPALEKSFREFEGKKIQLPEKLAEPDLVCLQHHREHVFQ